MKKKITIEQVQQWLTKQSEGHNLDVDSERRAFKLGYLESAFVSLANDPKFARRHNIKEISKITPCASSAS